MQSPYNSVYSRFLYPKFRNFDLFYKTNQNFGTNTFKKSSVSLSIVFKDIKLSLRLAITVFGFGLQTVSRVFAHYKFNFGFKTKIKFTCFKMTSHTFFNDLSFFFFFNFLYKAIPLGLFKGFYFSPSHVSKFLVSDIFNFFGARFFSAFYVDFFDWPSKLVFSYRIPVFGANDRVVPIIFSKFKVYLKKYIVLKWF